MSPISLLPLAATRVLEFTHAVMGPTAGLLLADIGAEVIHIEPPQGDPTRHLKGSAKGNFPFLGRNKKSLAVDLKSVEGKALIGKLVPTADILVENFAPGTMERLGYGYEAMRALSQGYIPPMPARVSGWSIYRVFETGDGESIFVGVISDKHWRLFCQAFERPDWAADLRLTTNNGRIDERTWLLPAVADMLRGFTKQEIITRCDTAGIPFAPIARPEDLFDDPQLNQSGNKGLLQTTLPDGTRTKLPRLPLEMGHYDFGLRNDPPGVGADTDALLRELGYSADDIKALKDTGKVA